MSRLVSRRLASARVRLLAATLLCTAPHAGLAQSLTLDEAVRSAVDRAPSLEAGTAGVAAARAEQARAGALPEPVLTFGIDNLPITGADALDPTADFMTMKKIGLRQEIPAGAKRAAQRALAARAVAKAVAQAMAERQRVRAATADAWIALWSARQEVRAVEALRAQAALAARIAKARLAGGADSAVNALAAQAAVLEIDTRLQGAQATAAAASVELQRWVGERACDPADAVPDFATLRVPAARLLAALDRTGRLSSASADVETAAAAIDVARADRHADWSLAASYGQRSGGRDDMLMLEVGLGLPLFRRHRQDRGIAAREADYQAALATREDLRREATARVRADIARWEGLRRQVALHEDALLPLAHDRSQVALAAYRAGGALQPWLEAWRDELQVHLAHAEHVGALGRAWAALAYLLPEDAP